MLVQLAGLFKDGGFLKMRTPIQSSSLDGRSFGSFGKPAGNLALPRSGARGLTYFAKRFLPQKPSPTKPTPKSNIVDGSGTLPDAVDTKSPVVLEFGLTFTITRSVREYGIV